MNDVHFEKLRRSSAYRDLADAIQKEIIEGRLKPGDLLPTELRLAEEFGVNRSTVREGIRVLEEAGFVVREAGRRLRISQPSSDALGNRVTQAMILHQVTFGELWEVTVGMEPLAARLAAMRCSPEQIARLKRNLQETEAHIDDPDRLVLIDREFHSLIAAAAGNRALLMARAPLDDLFYPAFERVLGSVKTAAKRLLTAHQKIFAAISKGDGDAAVDWMQKHIMDFNRGFQLAGGRLEDPLSRRTPLPNAQGNRASRTS